MEIINNSRHSNLLKGYNMLLYFAGSMIMYEPSEECITDFWANGVLKNLPVTSLNPNFIKAASQLRESCIDKHTCGKMMHEDYLRLFARDKTTTTSPFESNFRLYGKEMQANTPANVSEFYESYGWISKFKGKISDDHLGIELLFLTLLLDKYMILDDDACRAEMKKEIKRFLSQHLLWWLPEWNQTVQTCSKTLCFKGIGTLILACCEDIYSILDQKEYQDVSVQTLKN
jgi:TorA maturation chaperone TorD